MTSSLYPQKIDEEAFYWDERAEALLATGRISLWFDHRRGEDVDSLPAELLRGAGLRARPRLYHFVYGPLVDDIIRQATRTKGRVLDLGCGAGWFSLELARRGLQVEGYDIGSRQIEIARRFAHESRASRDPLVHGDFGSVDYRVVDLNKAVLLEERYDTVVSIGTLHHIVELDHLLGEIHRSLKPRGRFLFYEYLGYRGLARIFEGLLKILSVTLRLAAGWNTSARAALNSPFEGVSKRDIMDKARERFPRLECREIFLFLPDAVSRLQVYRWPKALGGAVVRMLRWLDQMLLSAPFLHGPYVLVKADKD